VQLQWYLFVTGLDWGYFATLIGGNKYREYEVTRDEELIEQLVRLASGFWHEYVLQNIARPVDDSEACKSLLQRLYPTGKDATTLLPEESEHIETYFVLKEQIKELETALTGVENHFKNLLGSYEVGTVASYMVKWQNRSRTSVDTKQLKELYPDAYAQCLKQTAFRQFSIGKEKTKHGK
jgi:predicted phage-related endonuclease